MAVSDASIRQVALDLFAQKGYASVTTREIARQSGITEMTFFRKFQTKRNLFDQIMAEASATTMKAEHFASIDVSDLNMAFRQAMRLIYESFRQQKQLLRVILNSPEVIDQQFNETLRRNGNSLEAGIRLLLLRCAEQHPSLAEQANQATSADEAIKTLTDHISAQLIGFFVIAEIGKFISGSEAESMLDTFADMIVYMIRK